MRRPVVRPHAAGPCDAVGDEAFAGMMARLGPFERRPRLAVAVSGGPDSLALCLLAARWAAVHGGRVTGLTVDHGLRPEAGAEAALVGRWLAGHGVAHAILTWSGPKPRSGVQAASRAARYHLLGDWCRAERVLHLLLGHHLEDQAETVVLRAARASGPDGLAAMAAVREVAGLRHLRPLLGLPKARLTATLSALGQPWLEDPSNAAKVFARARLRADASWDRLARAASAARHGTARAERERRLAAWLARHGRIDPAGFAWLDRRALGDAAEELAARALGQILGVVGGAPYPPRRARLAGLLDWLRAGAPSAGRTLGGCRLVPRGDRLLVCREAGAIGEDVSLTATWQIWDRRFAVRAPATSPGGPLIVRALDDSSWARRHRLRPVGPGRTLPGLVRPTLPAVWQGALLVAIPHLDLRAPDLTRPPAEVRLRPARVLAGAPFAPAAAGTDRESWLMARDSLC